MIKIRVNKKGFAKILARIKEDLEEAGGLAVQDTAYEIQNIIKDKVCEDYELEPYAFSIPSYYDEDMNIEETSAKITITGEEIPLEEFFYLDGPDQTVKGDAVYYKIRRGKTEQFPSYGFIGNGRAWKRTTPKTSPYFKYGTPTIPDMIKNLQDKILSEIGDRFEENLNSRLDNI